MGQKTKIIKRFIKDNPFLFTLFCIGIILRFFASYAEPFLHPWDERFHALVSMNMINDPLRPMLHANPLLPYSLTEWCCNHVWLHKPPLFLWQMALSMKLFGVSEIALRLPSVLQGSLMILLIYRLAYILTHGNKRVGNIAALLMTLSSFQIKTIAGIQSMDHNDLAHQFYILCSIWALAEYHWRPNNKWIILIGCFAGAAILNKWLTGLLVFLIWGIYLLASKKLFAKTEIKKIALALLITTIVVLPWQLYIFWKFPSEASYELSYINKHLTEAVEGHEGAYWFHILQFSRQYGDYICWLIVPGMILTLFRSAVNKQLNLALLGGYLFTLIFYSFFVASKVEAFVFFVAPIGMIYIAISINSIVTTINRLVIQRTIILIAGIITLNIPYFINYYSKNNIERMQRKHNASIYKSLRLLISKDVQVVINTNSYEDKDVMFYNPGLAAYHWVPSEAAMQYLASKKIKVAAFKDHNEYVLPDYILNYPEIEVIDAKLFSFK